MNWDNLTEESSQLSTPPGHQGIKASSFTTGAFNICCTVTFEDEFRVFKDPSVGLSDLEKTYQRMAEVMLEVLKSTFSSIEALEFELGKWQVIKRPMTLSMNELVYVGNLPPAIFTRKIFPIAAEYFEELAIQQLLHILQACEDRQMQNGTLTDSQHLSDWMACLFGSIFGLYPVPTHALWTVGSFGFGLLHKGVSCLMIFWTFLDEKHFGHLNSLDDRLSLLSQDELDELDGFVQMKMQQVVEKCLDERLTFDELVDL
ncbi:hypothetical protein I7I51_02737 [Histoplasma capsulatum]|uniref:Uncharacterized protein n=1 Tax=Ajellomyces capsulatus TaxID=5037 RepID=A0A8A1ML21_AJECA|nr:hypothetical protein I7I51_02737 [Histoplasma capsulatum]